MPQRVRDEFWEFQQPSETGGSLRANKNSEPWQGYGLSLLQFLGFLLTSKIWPLNPVSCEC